MNAQHKLNNIVPFKFYIKNLIILIMNDCGICLQIMERDLWHCKQCRNKLHNRCYKRWNSLCPFCRYLNSDIYIDCTFCCVGLCLIIFDYLALPDIKYEEDFP